MISRIESKSPANRRKMILRILSFVLLVLVLAGTGIAQDDDDENTGLISQLFKKKSEKSSSDSPGSSSSWFHKKPTSAAEEGIDSEEKSGFSSWFSKKSNSATEDEFDPEEKSGFSTWFHKKSDSDTEKISNSGEKPSISSWFHKKTNNTQNPTSNSVKPAAGASRKQNTERAPLMNTALDDFSDEGNSAPLPPNHPYYEKNRKASAGNNRLAVPLSESAQLPEPDTVPLRRNQEGKSSEESSLTGLSSYSFDTRDWVESFPVEHISGLDGYSSNQAMPLEEGEIEIPRLSSTQTVAMKTPVSTTVSTPAERQSDNTPPPVTAKSAPPVASPVVEPVTAPSTSQWDGQAEPVPVKSPKLALSKPSFLNSGKKFETTQSETPAPRPVRSKTSQSNRFDLDPSYLTRLKYSEVYGVIVVQANFPLTEISSILEEIEQLQVDLNKYMGVPAPREKIELCLFRDEKSYVKFLQEIFPKAPRDRRALYIKIDNEPGVLLVQKTEEFDVDLRHEMTHAIIHASIVNVPIWLDEGLAKYFEVPLKDRAENNPYMKQVRRNTLIGAVPSLARLEKLEHIGQMGVREYRDSWAWVHFLIHNSPQTHKLLAGYLQLLSTLPTAPAKGQDEVKIPPLGPYLDDTVPNLKEHFREHFQGQNTAK